MIAPADVLRAPPLSRPLASLREIDIAAHDAFTAVLPWLADHLQDEGTLAAVTDLASQIAMEAPEAARAFAERLHRHPEMAADADGLRRWALHGLQRHRYDAKRRLDYFERGDPFVFSDGHTRNDTEYLLRQRRSLHHYLVGFGFQHSIDFHEPQGAGTASPAATVDDQSIRLPRRLDDIEPGQRDLFTRAMLAHVAAHLLHSPLARTAGNRRPTLVALTALIEDARAERLMVQEHPGLHALWDLFHTASKERSGYDLAGLAARLARALHDPAYIDINPWVRKGRQLFEEAAQRDLRDVAAFDRIARDLSIDLGKMHLSLPRYYRPAPAYRDDNALLWRPDPALPIDETAHVDVVLEFGRRDESQKPQDLSGIDLRLRYHYPEWDHRLEALRENWVTVLERPRTQISIAERPGFTAASRPRIHGVERTPDRSIRLTRRAEGDELDLNAAVDHVVQTRAGLTPDGRIFVRHGRRRRSTAIVLLMDLSTSTDRFVPGSFTRVIDLERQAATIVADALDATRDRIAVHGFCSNGRHEVLYQRIKDFDEPFGSRQRERLAALTSTLSTRMGAALRHATTALAAEDADQKVILVLTDGEPSDIDVVEDDYLMEDAREAAVNAARHKVRTFCLTLDRRADRYVRRIFGERNFMIVERASAFTSNAGRTLMRLLAQ